MKGNDLFNLFGVQQQQQQQQHQHQNQFAAVPAAPNNNGQAPQTPGLPPMFSPPEADDLNAVNVEILFWSRQHQQEAIAKLRNKVKNPELLEKLVARVRQKADDVLHLIFRNVDRSIINAIRRSMTEWVPTMTIDTMEPKQNQWEGVLHENFIAHRLGLIPLISESLENGKPIDHFHKVEECDCAIGCELCTVTFELDIDIPKSTDEAPQTDTYVYSGDLQLDVYNPEIRPASKNIQITKLAPGTGIHFKAYVHKGVGREHAKWSPVVAPAVYPTPTIELNDTVIFQMSPGERENFIKSCPSNVFALHPENERMIDIEDSLKCTTCESCIKWCRTNNKPPDTVKIGFNLDK